MFVDQQDFFYMLDKDGTACSAHLESIAIGAVEILLTTLSKCTKFHRSQPFDVTDKAAQAHHAHDIINPYFTNKNT